MDILSNRVLIVDDALIMRQRIREIAEQAGWKVVAEANDGEEALALYQLERPDLVTLDIVMPGLDGVATLRALVQCDPNARVVMISAVDQKKLLAECIDAGALDFIVKPFERTSMLRFFQKYLTA